MGRIVEHKVCYTERRLELTGEDLQKQKERRERWHRLRVSPALTEHEKRFIEHLLKCPVCGKTPQCLKVAGDVPSGYEYKLRCPSHCSRSGIYLDCTDWFYTLSEVGMSWNQSVRWLMMVRRKQSGKTV